MQYSTKATTPGRSVSSMRALGMSVLLLAVFTGYTLAQSPRPVPKPKADAPPEPKAGPQATPKAEPNATPNVRPAPRTRHPGGKGSRNDPGFVMSPNAKWACDQQSVTLEPVWRGDKPLTFAFDIRNEGTADLKIKARGG